jgi:hypothetical protein
MKHGYFFLSPILFTLLLSLFSLQVNAQENLYREQLDQLDRYYAKALNDWDVPGMAIAIVKGNEIIICQRLWRKRCQFRRTGGQRNTVPDCLQHQSIHLSGACHSG